MLSFCLKFELLLWTIKSLSKLYLLTKDQLKAVGPVGGPYAWSVLQAVFVMSLICAVVL